MEDELDKDYWNLKNFKMNDKNLWESLLGWGSYASVYLVQHKVSKKYYAIKSVD